MIAIDCRTAKSYFIWDRNSAQYISALRGRHNNQGIQLIENKTLRISRLWSIPIIFFYQFLLDIETFRKETATF